MSRDPIEEEGNSTCMHSEWPSDCSCRMVAGTGNSFGGQGLRAMKTRTKFWGVLAGVVVALGMLLVSTVFVVGRLMKAEIYSHIAIDDPHCTTILDDCLWKGRVDCLEYMEGLAVIYGGEYEVILFRIDEHHESWAAVKKTILRMEEQFVYLPEHARKLLRNKEPIRRGMCSKGVTYLMLEESGQKLLLVWGQIVPRELVKEIVRREWWDFLLWK